MLEQAIQKLMPYRVQVVPAVVYEHSPDGRKDVVGSVYGFEKRFMTRRRFEKFIARLEDPNNPSYRGSVVASRRLDDRTYIGVPNICPLEEGEFSLDIPEHFKKQFRGKD